MLNQTEPNDSHKVEAVEVYQYWTYLRELPVSDECNESFSHINPPGDRHSNAIMISGPR